MSIILNILLPVFICLLLLAMGIYATLAINSMILNKKTVSFENFLALMIIYPQSIVMVAAFVAGIIISILRDTGLSTEYLEAAAIVTGFISSFVIVPSSYLIGMIIQLIIHKIKKQPLEEK